MTGKKKITVSSGPPMQNKKKRSSTGLEKAILSLGKDQPPIPIPILVLILIPIPTPIPIPVPIPIPTTIAMIIALTSTVAAIVIVVTNITTIAIATLLFGHDNLIGVVTTYLLA